MPRQKRTSPDPLQVLEERALFLEKTLHHLKGADGGVAPIREKLAIMRDSLLRVQLIRDRLRSAPSAPIEALLAYEWQNMNDRCQDLNRAIQAAVPSLLESLSSPIQS